MEWKDIKGLVGAVLLLAIVVIDVGVLMSFVDYLRGTWNIVVDFLEVLGNSLIYVGIIVFLIVAAWIILKGISH